MSTETRKWLRPDKLVKVFGIAFFVYLFFGFMLLPCLNTLTQIFTTKNAAGETDPWLSSAFSLRATCRSTCGIRSSWPSAWW